MAQKLSRRKIAAYVADGLISGTSSVFSQLAAYLVETKRQREAILLVRDIEAALADRGVVIARITTAAPLDKDSIAEVETFIGAQCANLTTLHASYEQNSSLLGGLRVETPDFQYDDTLSTRLQQLTTRNS